jgi:hypothetical protein
MLRGEKTPYAIGLKPRGRVTITSPGADFTSLAHLGDLAVGELKLDRTFVTGLTLQEKVRDLELVRFHDRAWPLIRAVGRRRGCGGSRDA